MTNITKKLTIVLPTKNRLLWVTRVLIYYSKNNFYGKILILDSSSKKTYEKLENLVNDFEKLDISLRSFPEMNLEQSINSASNLIDTEYCTFLADDDILLLSGLCKNIEFLELSKNYIGAIGNGYMISTFNNGPFGKINSIKKYTLNGYDEEDAFLRIKQFLHDVKNTSFSILRTNIFVEGYKIIMQIDKDYQTYIFGELIQSLHYLFNGRIKKIEVDYLVRQYHSENTYIKLSKKLIDKKKWNDSCELIYNFITNLFDVKKKIVLNGMLSRLFDNYLKKKNEVRVEKKILIQWLIKITMIKKLFIFLRYIFKDYQNLKINKKNKNIKNYFEVIEQYKKG